MFYKRDLETVVHECSTTFPALLVTGPRQVGKSTLLESCAGPDRRIVTLDDPETRRLAREDPAFFFQTYRPPLLIDEIQYAPGLFPFVKMVCDREKRPGLFWMTGSQQFDMMRNVSESLAGRVAVLDLLGLSSAEIDGRPRTGSFLDRLLADTPPAIPPATAAACFKRILRGSYPALWANPRMDPARFHASYVRTYLERDVRQIVAVEKESAFLLFLRLCAARTGQTLNMANLARDAGVAPNTAKAWLSVLETSGLVHLLRPYSRNLSNRIAKTPKLYFTDTGLACHLAGWTSPEALRNGTYAGAILETAVVAEVLKSFRDLGRPAPLWYYRDHDGREIDLVLEADQKLHPVEIKMKSSPSPSDCASFSVIPQDRRGRGAVICFTETRVPLSRDIRLLNVADI